MTPQESVELRRLRDRVENIERALEVSQTTVERIMAALGLTWGQAKIVEAIVRRKRASCTQIANDVYAIKGTSPQDGAGTVRVQIVNLRKRLARKGVSLSSADSGGYWFEPEDLQRIRALGALA